MCSTLKDNIISKRYFRNLISFIYLVTNDFGYKWYCLHVRANANWKSVHWKLNFSDLIYLSFYKQTDSQLAVTLGFVKNRNTVLFVLNLKIHWLETKHCNVPTAACQAKLTLMVLVPLLWRQYPNKKNLHEFP